MTDYFSYYFSEYKKNEQKFKEFHNQIINMPRANFGEIKDFLNNLKNIAQYILNLTNEFLSKELNYKELYNALLSNYRNKIFPIKRDYKFEINFLNVDGNIDEIYAKKGRMFRHYMSYFDFFGFMKDGERKRNKIFNIDSLKELVLFNDESNLINIYRNRLLNLNINNNNYIKNLKSISINDDATYCPARAILNYCNTLQRSVTDFEVSILLGRIDNKLQKEEDILQRAISLGNILPENKNEQITTFFQNMEWHNDGISFQYKSSQNPDFKFKTFLLLMETFGLIRYDRTTSQISLTDESKQLLKEGISLNILDLNKLLSEIDNDIVDNNQLINLIIQERKQIITAEIKADGQLVEKLNKRNIRTPIIKNGRRIRNKLIAAIAKIKCNYLDELTKQPSFVDKNGNNYVEAHHIIEFKGENGPDVTDNLIILSPQNHSLIHHGAKFEVDNFYKECKKKNVINFEKISNICIRYQCLTNEHIKILHDKQIINDDEAKELKKLVHKYGINKYFIDKISASKTS